MEVKEVRKETPPHVAENIIFATSYAEAKTMAAELGVEFEDVQWYRSPALLGDADVSEKKIHYSPTFTHRPDYSETRERVKLKGRGNK